METEKRNLYSRYKQDADASKHGYYGYELWLEKKLIEAESELKKLRVGDVSGMLKSFVAYAKSRSISDININDDTIDYFIEDFNLH